MVSARDVACAPFRGGFNAQPRAKVPLQGTDIIVKVPLQGTDTIVKVPLQGTCTITVPVFKALADSNP